jgi:hypothetical protein
MRKLIVASLALLTGALAVVPASAAIVDVQVVMNGSPVEGATVDVFASDGAYSGITESDGTFSADIRGKYFRVRVNELTVDGVHNVNEGTIVVELSAR